MKDNDNECGPVRFYMLGWCRFCESVTNIDIGTHRCEVCHTKQATYTGPEVKK